MGWSLMHPFACELMALTKYLLCWPTDSNNTYNGSWIVFIYIVVSHGSSTILLSYGAELILTFYIKPMNTINYWLNYTIHHKNHLL